MSHEDVIHEAGDTEHDRGVVYLTRSYKMNRCGQQFLRHPPPSVLTMMSQPVWWRLKILNLEPSPIQTFERPSVTTKSVLESSLCVSNARAVRLLWQMSRLLSLLVRPEVKSIQEPFNVLSLGLIDLHRLARMFDNWKRSLSLEWDHCLIQDAGDVPVPPKCRVDRT